MAFWYNYLYAVWFFIIKNLEANAFFNNFVITFIFLQAANLPPAVEKLPAKILFLKSLF